MNNIQRANAAQEALFYYAKSKEGTRKKAMEFLNQEDMQTKVADLLSDLLHLASDHGQGVDLDRVVRIARDNFEAERK